MSLVEKALHRLRRQAEAKEVPLAVPRESHVSDTDPTDHDALPATDQRVRLEAKSPDVAQFCAEADDPAWLAWALEGNAALLSQLRALRREIGQQLHGESKTTNAKIMVVTSALPGEGKTFTSLALARTMAADKGRRVVLIDGDLPRRQLTRLFRLNEQPGLSDCLAGRADIRDLLHATDIEGLLVLPAGKWTPDAADDMSGSRFDELLTTLRGAGPDYCFVLDTAPILAAGETVYAAGRADLTVLVVRAGHTPRGAVEETLRKLGSETQIGLLLNGQHMTKISDYYGYSDNYGHGQNN